MVLRSLVGQCHLYQAVRDIYIYIYIYTYTYVRIYKKSRLMWSSLIPSGEPQHGILHIEFSTALTMWDPFFTSSVCRRPLLLRIVIRKRSRGRRRRMTIMRRRRRRRRTRRGLVMMMTCVPTGSGSRNLDQSGTAFPEVSKRTLSHAHGVGTSGPAVVQLYCCTVFAFPICQRSVGRLSGSTDSTTTP